MFGIGQHTYIQYMKLYQIEEKVEINCFHHGFIKLKRNLCKIVFMMRMTILISIGSALVIECTRIWPPGFLPQPVIFNGLFVKSIMIKGLLG